ncbi:MAG: polyphosphate kinase 2 family protein [Gemmatimonadales bacterium]|nr:polyphosphate kinase 2 family protein [Gemmatimonadales bacterium]
MTPRLDAVAPGTAPDLSDEAARAPKGTPRGSEANALLDPLRHRMEDLQHALGAENRRALLVVLQGRDAAGKDGTIKRVFGDLNPAYCRISTFKRPTPLELRHDFLWRVHHQIPPAGVIGVFNRSHYEDVLPVRVHRLAPESLWRARYRHINEFERMLVDHGVTILKFFLHISKQEQRERLEERLNDPTKNWKFDSGDLKERELWDDYTEAYHDMFVETGTAHAPWYLVPADQKATRDLLIAEIVVDALERIDPRYPEADPAVLAYRGKIR